MRSLIKKQACSGQATVEYILLMVIVVAIAMALKGPFGKLKGWSQSMVGPEGYYGCLMQGAWLPGDPTADLDKCKKERLEMASSLQALQGGTGGSSPGSGNPNTNTNPDTNRDDTNRDDTNRDDTNRDDTNHDDTNHDTNPNPNPNPNPNNPYKQDSAGTTVTDNLYAGNKDKFKSPYASNGEGDGKDSQDPNNKGGADGDSDDRTSGLNSGSDEGITDPSKSAKRFRAGSQKASRRAGGAGGQDASSSDLARSSFAADSSAGANADGEGGEGSGSGDSQDGDDSGLSSGGFGSQSGGYKRRWRPRRGASSQAYLGEFYEEQEEVLKKKTFKAPTAQDSGPAEQSNEIQDSATKSRLADSTQKKSEEVSDKTEKINFLGFMKYFFIGALVILLLAIIFSQVMEYQSRD